MIRLEILLDGSGRLLSLSASGHAGYGRKGRDIVCSAVTVIVRTFCRLVEDAEGIDSSGGSGSDGTIGIEIRHVPASRLDWFRGVTDFLVCALSDIRSEYPERVSLGVRQEMHS